MHRVSAHREAPGVNMKKCLADKAFKPLARDPRFIALKRALSEPSSRNRAGKLTRRNDQGGAGDSFGASSSAIASRLAWRSSGVTFSSRSVRKR